MGSLVYYLTGGGREAMSAKEGESKLPLDYRRLLSLIELEGHVEVLRGRLRRFPDRLRVRYRYDGVLHEVEPPPARLQAAVISRVKIMARLDIAERRLPQDGRIKLTVRGHEIDFRGRCSRQ